MADALQDFAAFATQAHAYKATLGWDSTGRTINSAVVRLRALCFPELPFQKRIDALMEKQGSAFHALPGSIKQRYRTVAGNIDTYLAGKGYAPNTVPDDVEGLNTFLEIGRKACEEHEGDTAFKACLNLWREECHPLYLDDRFDAAIAAHPGVDKTKALWRGTARRLADYVWCHPMPAAGYVDWVCSLAQHSEERKKVCAWPGAAEGHLLPLVRHVQQVLRAGAA